MPAKERPKDCSVFAKRLSRYADGDLGPVEAEESGLHIKSCPNCAAKFEAHRKMILLLDSSKEVEAPWDLDLKVLEAIGFGGARTQLRGRSVSPSLVWAAGVAAIVLVGAGGLVLRDGVAAVMSTLFGPSGLLSSEEMAGLASTITRYFVTIWDSLTAGLSTLRPLFRSAGAVSDAAWGSPAVMGAIIGTLAFVLVFLRIITNGKRSRVTSNERRTHVGSSR